MTSPSISTDEIELIDLYCDPVLADPYPYYRRLRDAAPAVWLASAEAWFIGRRADVRSALRDWESWSSASGVGLNATINAAGQKGVISSDPPIHTRLRQLFTDRLGPRQLKVVEQTIDRRADMLAERIAQMETFDAVTDVAHDLPINVVMDLIGWPEAARKRLYALADGTFNAWGPDNLRARGAINRYQEIRLLIGEIYDADELIPGGFGATIAAAAQSGDITREQALGQLSGYVVAAFDTTINAIANGLVMFAQNPDQWDLLRSQPSLAMPAFNEILRYDSPVQSFSRVATRDIEMGEGISVPRGARAILSFGSANRDERHFNQPDRFDILRRPLDHLSFGMGIHTCAGQSLARLEGEAVLRALARRIKRLDLAAEPVRELINIGRGYRHAPMRAAA